MVLRCHRPRASLQLTAAVLLLLTVVHSLKIVDPLLDFLDNLKLRIPNQDFKRGLISFHIRNFVCTHFYVEGVQSNVSDNGMALQMDVSIISAVCVGQYASTGGVSGDVTATLHPPPSTTGLSLTTELVDRNNHTEFFPIPDHIEVDSCLLHMGVSDLHFSGSMSAKLIDLFKSSIVKAINNEVSSDKLCGLLQNKGLPFLNMYLQKAVRWLLHYVDGDDAMNDTRPVARTMSNDPKTTIQFQDDLPIFYRSLDFLNRAILQKHLDVGPLESHCGGASEGVNGILRDMLPHSIPIPVHISPSFDIMEDTELKLHISELQVQNIPRFDDLTLLQPNATANGVFTSRFETPKTTITVNVNLTIARSEYVLTENFDVTIDMHNVKLYHELDVQLDKAVFEKLPTAVVLRALHNDPECLLQSFTKLTVSNLEWLSTISDIVVSSAWAIDDPLETDLDVLISNVLSLLTLRYPELVTQSLHGLMRGPVADRINAFFGKHRSVHPGQNNCTYEERSPLFVNYTEWHFLRRMNDYLNDSLPRMNQYMDCTAKWAAQQAIDNFPNMSSIQLLDLEIVEAGSLRDFKLLSPHSDGVHLNTTLRWDQPQLFASVLLNLFDVPITVNTTVSLNDIDFNSSALSKYDEHYFKELTLQKLLSHGQCALLPAKEINLFDVYESSLGMFDMIVNVSVATENATHLYDFDSTDFSEIQSGVVHTFAWMMGTARDFVLAGTKVGSSDSSHCEDSSSRRYDGPSQSDDGTVRKGVPENTVLLLLVLVFVFAQPAILLVKRSRSTAESTEENEGSDMEEPLLDTSEHSSPVETRRPTNSSLMYRAPRIARQVVPLFAILSIALLVSSNSTVGASVDLKASMGNHSFRLPSLFSFSLLNTAKSMFAAGIYPLFFLVVVFSGVWPYVKLLLLLMAWIVPEPKLLPQNRGSLLLRLDALSKFSLVDAYVLVVMLVAFRYHLSASTEIALDVYVTPQFGFYGFLIATTVSLGIGHVMVFYHRHAEQTFHGLPTEPSSVLQHSFVVGATARRLSSTTRVFLLGTFLIVTLFLGVGILQKSFEFEFGGIAGLLLGDARHTSYSLLTIGAAIPSSVENPGVGVYMLQAAFYFYAVITPFLALLCLFILLVCPLSLSKQQLVLTVAEIANAWSAIEVFALSIVAALWEISTFAEFIVGNRCDFLEVVLSQYNHEMACFEVNCSVSKSSIFLIFGVVLNSAWVSIVLRLVRICIHERSRTEEGAVVIAGNPLIRKLSAFSGIFERDNQPEPPPSSSQHEALLEPQDHSSEYSSSVSEATSTVGRNLTGLYFSS